MGKDNEVYLIYRSYNDDPELRDQKDLKNVLFAWTSSKVLLKGFLKQRDNKKYMVIRIEKQLFEESYEQFTNSDRSMLNYVKLKSVKTGEECYFFTTLAELENAEIKIQQYFSDLSEIDNTKNIDKIVIAFMNLKQYYLEALYFIGFRPSQIDEMFPSANSDDNYNNYTKIETEIEDAYSSIADYPLDDFECYDYKIPTIPGLNVIDDVHNKILYSLESFIKVLKDDL